MVVAVGYIRAGFYRHYCVLVNQTEVVQMMQLFPDTPGERLKQVYTLLVVISAPRDPVTRVLLMLGLADSCLPHD